MEYVEDMMKKLFSEIPYLQSERIVLRKLVDADADALRELVDSPAVYRYLPTFLFEKQYGDIHYVIRHLYDECFKESIILGVFLKDAMNPKDAKDAKSPKDADGPKDPKDPNDAKDAKDAKSPKDADSPKDLNTSKDADDPEVPKASNSPKASNDSFCGLAELYGFRDPIHKVSTGYRLLERYWGQGIASEALGLMVRYLYDETDIEIITASTMIENIASAKVLRKNGFSLVVHAVGEDWGYEAPTITDKWIR